MPGHTVDGNDPDAVYEAVAEAVDRAREGSGPSIVEAMTERLVGHYSGDAQHYRPAGEIAAARLREPLARVRAAAADDAELTARLDAIDAEVTAEIEAAVTAARAVPTPDPATAKEHVYV